MTRRPSRKSAAGPGRSSTSAALVDTNLLVYRFDARFPEKQRRANEILRQGIADDTLRVPHQALVEFVAAATRPQAGAAPILAVEVARREAEEMLSQAGEWTDLILTHGHAELIADTLLLLQESHANLQAAAASLTYTIDPDLAKGNGITLAALYLSEFATTGHC